ncbi:MAG: EamA family transporter [Gemmatimonadota bacterium]|nr:EamA family transporter [Gemmatimonadota bacterium]
MTGTEDGSSFGILGNGLYQTLFVEGLSRTNVGNAVLIVAAAPAFIAIRM